MRQHMMPHIAHIMHMEAIPLLKIPDFMSEPSCSLDSNYICIDDIITDLSPDVKSFLK